MFGELTESSLRIKFSFRFSNANKKSIITNSILDMAVCTIKKIKNHVITNEIVISVERIYKYTRNKVKLEDDWCK